MVRQNEGFEPSHRECFIVQSIEIGYKVFFSDTWKNKLVGNGEMLILFIFISRNITEYVFIEFHSVEQKHFFCVKLNERWTKDPWLDH